MKRFFFLSLMACALSTPPAEAAEATISPELFTKLQGTDRLISDKAYGKARQQLQSMLNDAKPGSLDQAVVLRSLSSVYAAEEQYGKAAELLAKSVALNTLPDAQQQAAILNLGQLYMATEQYRKAVDVLEPWLAKHSVPDVQTQVMLANAYTQLKQYRKALPHISQAIQSTPKPEESWQQLQLALFFELKDYQSAIPVLRKLIAANPANKEHWSQLASVYQQLNQNTQAATIKHLAYKKGLMSSEKEVLELIALFLYAGSPYKAASILEAELSAKRVSHSAKNWELLANAWTQARELNKAVQALETASKLDEKGEHYLQLGQIYFEKENWPAAIAAINKAIAKGGLKNPGNAYMILGMSYYESNNTEHARQAFSKAKAYPDNRKSADQWLSFLGSGEQTS